MKIRSLSLKVALAGGVALAVIFGGSTFILVSRVSGVIAAQTEALENETASNAARDVSDRLDAAAATARDLTSSVETLQASHIAERTLYDAVLRAGLDRNPGLLGAWAGFEAGALDAKDKDFAGKPGYDATGRYLAYWYRGAGVPQRQVLTGYDSEENGAYYQQPKRLDRAVAIEPYFYPVAGKDALIMSFGVPIKAGDRYLGTAGVDVDLTGIHDALAGEKPFGTGYLSLVSAHGLAVAHPDAKATGKPLTTIDPPAAAAAEAAMQSHATARSVSTGIDGRVWHYIAEPIQAGETGESWAVVVAVPEATIRATADSARWSMIAVSLVSVLLIAGILYALLRSLVGRPLTGLRRTIDAMANGDYDRRVADADRTDEVGEIGRAVERFRDGLKAKLASEAELDALREERRNAMAELADQFEGAVGGIVALVSDAASELQATAGMLRA